jgi:8-oxo-dGTP diphosphatase
VPAWPSALAPGLASPLATGARMAKRPITPLLTVDCVVFDKRGRLLLIRRGIEPFLGQYALPGGLVELGETVEDAARRELEEETAVKARDLLLVGAYSEPGRDPRKHTVSLAFTTILPNVKPRAGDDAAAAAWVRDWPKEKLGFDHNQMVRDAYRLLRRKRLLPAIKL